MKNCMLTYSKLILEKVSFSPELFEKELRKAIGRLLHEEVTTLRHWCQQRFSDRYAGIIEHCFGRPQPCDYQLKNTIATV